MHNKNFSGLKTELILFLPEIHINNVVFYIIDMNFW